jgi:enoyl-CoA hydratase/carnithine racemase
MNSEKMIFRVEDGIGYITFNNPEKHNAVSIEMWDALENILDGFRENQNLFQEQIFLNLIKNVALKMLF